MITITHTPVDGTVLDGTEPGDGTNHILKPLGWRWSPNLGGYLRPSRDSVPRTAVIEATAEKLRAAGHPVTVTINTGHAAIGRVH